LKTTDAQVETAVARSIPVGYKFWVWNCSDMTFYATGGCPQGLDQRVKWGLIFLAIIIIVLVIIK
jgi:hypothetical protein